MSDLEYISKLKWVALSTDYSSMYYYRDMKVKICGTTEKKIITKIK